MKLTPQKAINEKCYDCSYDDHDTGSKQAQVEACQDVHCPLYPLRPVTGATKAIRKQEKIASMPPEQRVIYDKQVSEARVRLAQYSTGA